MKPGALVVGAFALAFSLSACGGPPPESPTTSFRAEKVGVAKTVEALPCGDARVTLDSGDEVDLVLPGAPLTAATACPGSSGTPTRRLFGYTVQSGVTLFFYGDDAAGSPFYAAADHGTPTTSCGDDYTITGGAFEDGDTFHLPNGLVLGKAPGFVRGAWKDPAVVTVDQWLCVDSAGLVTILHGPAYM